MIFTSSPSARNLPTAASRKSKASVHASTAVFDSDSSVITHTLEDVECDDDIRDMFQYTKELQAKFEAIRKEDFARLDEQNCLYFDYTGGMLAPEELLDKHHKDLKTTVLGNPHSMHTPSATSTKIELEARSKVLDFCGANPDEYVVVWTPNASGALKLVGESFPFTHKSAYLYAPDCHTSVLGISRFAERKGAHAKGFDFLPNSLCYDFHHFQKQMKKLGKVTKRRAKLLGIPAESNVSGYIHNVKRYADHAHSLGWDVLVDAAAMAPTKRIQMEELGYPEFLCMSFYKIFGYPTGVGCLVAKKSALAKLQKPWFAGGTVRMVGVTSNTLTDVLVDGDMSPKFEDGTINYTSLQAVTNGLQYMEEKVGMEDLNKHVKFFSALIEHRLRSMRWENGNPLVRLPSMDSHDEDRGNAMGLIFLTPSGKLMPHKVVERILCNCNIAVRTGCFCNPGTAQEVVFPFMDTFGLSKTTMIDKFMKYAVKNGGKEWFMSQNPYQGMVRISVGLPTTMSDVDALLDCIRKDILWKPNEMEKESLEYINKATSPYSKC